MIEIDFWQSAAAIAGVTYTVGNIHQLRTTLKTRKTDGLSLPQWLMFFGASVVLTAYYAHLDQWLIASVSVIGTTCCAALSFLICKFRKFPDQRLCESAISIKGATSGQARTQQHL